MVNSQLDMTTGAGFREIASAFGVQRAFEARLAALDARIEETQHFRWHDRRWRQLKFSTEVDLEVWLKHGQLPQYAKGE